MKGLLMKTFSSILFILFMFSAQVHAQKWMTRVGKISFYSSTPVENIEALNNQVSAVLETQTGDVAFVVPIRGFKFEKALMQEHFNENYMESEQFPKATFKGKIVEKDKVDFTKTGIYNVTAKGQLTIHGVTKPVTITGALHVEKNSTTIASKFLVRPADYNIKIPSIAASKIAEKIEVTVDCKLNPTRDK
jgi:hypothetical protein